MNHPHTPKQTAPDTNPTVEQIFDVDDATPYETQRIVQRYRLAQTADRHNRRRPWSLFDLDAIDE